MKDVIAGVQFFGAVGVVVVVGGILCFGGCEVVRMWVVMRDICRFFFLGGSFFLGGWEMVGDGEIDYFFFFLS